MTVNMFFEANVQTRKIQVYLSMNIVEIPKYLKTHMQRLIFDQKQIFSNNMQWCSNNMQRCGHIQMSREHSLNFQRHNMVCIFFQAHIFNILAYGFINAQHFLSVACALIFLLNMLILMPIDRSKYEFAHV